MKAIVQDNYGSTDVLEFRDLVVMGELDPDFPDPRVEADWIAKALHAEVVMVPQAGQYPQSQSPQITTDAVLQLATEVRDHA